MKVLPLWLLLSTSIDLRTGHETSGLWGWGLGVLIIGYGEVSEMLDAKRSLEYEALGARDFNTAGLKTNCYILTHAETCR